MNTQSQGFSVNQTLEKHFITKMFFEKIFLKIYKKSGECTNHYAIEEN